MYIFSVSEMEFVERCKKGVFPVSYH